MNKEQSFSDSTSLKQLFFIFLRLGCTSFGGPIAHIGFFHQEFVVKRQWYTEEEYLQLVALSQILPGPASSQVGMAIGFHVKSFLGSLVSFIGFTLPSAILMACFALVVSNTSFLSDSSVLYILKIIAVAVVAQAIWIMSKAQCRDGVTASIAVLSACFALYIESVYVQLFIIVLGGLAGSIFCSAEQSQLKAKKLARCGAAHMLLIIIFFCILIFAPLIKTSSSGELFQIFDSFFRSGALVFGGGHVVLPLLENELVSTGLISNDHFLYGYGVAQAIPGPLFTFSSYLGALLPSENMPLIASALATVAVFLPGYLLIIGLLPFWQAISHNQKMSNTIQGVNAAVIGLLVASFFNPIWFSTIHSHIDIIFLLLILAALTIWKLSPSITVLVCIVAALLFDLF